MGVAGNSNGLACKPCFYKGSGKRTDILVKFVIRNAYKFAVFFIIILCFITEMLGVYPPVVPIWSIQGLV